METTVPAEGTLTLGELVTILWNGKWLILVSALVFGAAAGIAGWLNPASYSAASLLAPVTSASNGSQLGVLGAAAAQLVGAVGLGGISAGDTRKAESLAYLQSETLTERFIKENNLLPILYSKEWDSERNTWKHADREHLPTPWKANQYFKKKIRTVVTDAKTGLVTLTITWSDPQTAAHWANELVRMTNDYLRGRAIEESEKSILYLNEEAAKVNAVEARQVVYKVLESELSKIVFARGNSEYAFKVIDPAVPSERPSSVSPSIWALGGCIAGVLLAIPILLFRSNSMRAPTGSAQ